MKRKETMDIQGMTIFYNVYNKQRQFEMGFTVHKNIVLSIKEHKLWTSTTH